MYSDEMNEIILKLRNTNLGLEEVNKLKFLEFVDKGKVVNFGERIGKDSFCYRSLIHFADQKLLTTIDRVGVAPSDIAVEYGRCNLPKQQIFYASENIEISFAEQLNRFKVENKLHSVLYITTGKWKFNKDIDLVVVVHPKKEKRRYTVNNLWGNKFDNDLREVHRDHKSNITNFYEFLAEMFRKEVDKKPNIYHITSAFANITLLQEIPIVHGILYPSVDAVEMGVNVAINKDFAINYLELVEVERRTMYPTNKSCAPYFDSNEIINAKKIDYNNNLIIWE